MFRKQVHIFFSIESKYGRKFMLLILANNRAVGVAAFNEETKLRLVDVIVSNTLSQKSNGIAGRGLYVLDGAEVEVSCLFTKNRGSGVTAFNDGTLLTMNDIIISNTLEQQCATELKPSFLRCGIGKVEFETQCPFFRLSRFVFSNLSVARSSKNSRTRHIMRTNMGDEACDAQLARFFCS